MECRIESDLREAEQRSEQAEKEWVALCPAMRETAVEIAAVIMRHGRRHPLYLPAFEDGWLNVSDENEAQLVRCLAVYRGAIASDDLTDSQLRPIAEAALNAAIRSLYGNTETVATLCEDGYSETDFITDLLRA